MMLQILRQNTEPPKIDEKWKLLKKTLYTIQKLSNNDRAYSQIKLIYQRNSRKLIPQTSNCDIYLAFFMSKKSRIDFLESSNSNLHKLFIHRYRWLLISVAFIFHLFYLLRVQGIGSGVTYGFFTGSNHIKIHDVSSKHFYYPIGLKN